MQRDPAQLESGGLGRVMVAIVGGAVGGHGPGRWPSERGRGGGHGRRDLGAGRSRHGRVGGKWKIQRRRRWGEGRVRVMPFLTFLFLFFVK